LSWFTCRYEIYLSAPRCRNFSAGFQPIGIREYRTMNNNSKLYMQYREISYSIWVLHKVRAMRAPKTCSHTNRILPSTFRRTKF
jgi:hypothetical protein